MDISVLENILSWTANGKDYKNYCLVSKAWYTTISRIFPGGDKFCNHLVTLLMKLPNGSLNGEPSANKQWNYINLSNNTAITVDYIKANINKPWHYDSLSANTSISQELIDAYPDKPWDYNALCSNPSISWDFIFKNYNKITHKRSISYNPNIRQTVNIWEIIQNNSHVKWNYSSLSKIIAWENIYNNPDKNWDYDIVLRYNTSIKWKDVQNMSHDKIVRFYTYNENVMEDIENYEHLIDYSLLSQNFAVTEEYVLKHLDKPWDYNYLSTRLRKITWKLLSLTLDKPWNYYHLSYNADLSLDEFKKVPKKPWNYNIILRVATWDNLIKVSNELPAYSSTYSLMTSSYNIPLSIIFDNLDKPWDVRELSCRLDLTWRDVVNHPEIKWNFTELSRNRFKIECIYQKNTIYS